MLSVFFCFLYNVECSVLTEYKLSVSPEMDIMEYCRKEWRGNTPAAKRMRKVAVLFWFNFVRLFVFVCYGISLCSQSFKIGNAVAVFYAVRSYELFTAGRYFSLCSFQMCF